MPFLYSALIPVSNFCGASESHFIQAQRALNAVDITTVLCYFPYFLLLWDGVGLQIDSHSPCLTG